MKNEFIPYNEALALKELGFNESCLRVGNPNGHIMWKWIEVDTDDETVNIDNIINVKYLEEYIQIPTYSRAFRWFRKNYDLFGCIDLHASLPIHWFIRIDKISILILMKKLNLLVLRS